ncbi:MAG: DNA translocase FtsK, partial [Planctomycetia bacterium]|nr:DNA translocase FtsK [Planctomycetia bacterium]
MASIDRPLAPPFSTRFTARPSVAEPCAAPPARDRLRDISALALLAGCLFLVAALATYHPADPPLARGFPQHPQPRNACGLCGAAAAAVLTEWLGLGAWLVAALAAVLDAALLRRRPLADLPVRALGGVLAVVGVCTLAALSLPPWCPRPLSGPGGALGALGRLMAETYLATTGATILAAGLAAVGLFLACDALIVTLGGGCLAAVAAVAAGTQAAWRAVAVRMPRTRGADAAHPGPGGLRLHDADWADAPRAGDDDRNQDDDQDEDAEDAGPTIKVRRREVAPVEADDDSSFEADVDSFDTEASDGADPAGASEEDSAAVPVPIRSRTGRCKPGSVLEMAPDPSADYELPSVDLLLPAEQLQLDAQEQEVRERAKVLEKTFADFGFKVRVVEIETGPVISQYEIELEAGLRLAKIANLADDLAIALRVPSVRIVAPIPGKNSVGIEVPNTDRQMVRLREVIEETQAKSRNMKIPLYFGKDVAGNPMVFDMASLPHLLIAGRTGTGKSVCLNSIIVSMLMTRRPDEVRMLMIDPKMVELTPYKSLPHLMHPVVTDMKKAEAILAWAVDKMEERYALLARVGVRHLSQYNQLGREELLRRLKPESEEEAQAVPTTMPFIVMIADEIADMMMTAGKEIEQHIIRLAQKSRAVGIHLILATQKPTVDVITGLIKSNLPARIAFQVASRTDSRVVLDEMGAERLL